MLKEQTRIDELASEIIADFETYREYEFRYIMRLRDTVDAFDRLDPQRMQLYEAVANQINRSVKTLQNKVSVARNEYARWAYENGLEFSHVMAVSHLLDEHAYALLHEAAENFLDPAELGYIAKQRYGSIPAVGNSTPTADAVDRMLSDDEPPYNDDTTYNNDGPAWDEPNAYDNEDFVYVPREPLAAARKIKATFSEGDIATLVAELVQIPY